MRRREFITGLGSGLAWPVVARAQQASMPVIGFVSLASADAFEQTGYLAAFRHGLGDTSRGRTWRSSTTGWKADTIACRC
jgi:putative ABC transport system substrate-binding protein